MSNSKSKIQSLSSLTSKLKRTRRAKIVFTNGCFDILHAGHVQYLEKARKLGDILVVAVNSDASTRRLKGPSRPINRLQDRMQVLAGLAAVDYVVPFPEDTPLKTILKLKPTVLVKGGDWSPSSMVGASEVRSWGGTVKTIPYLKGRSTTLILKRSKGK